MNGNKDQSLYQMHAEICKTFTNPLRLMIIERLQEGQQTVSELEKSIGARQATISQHLALLREKGIVVAERQGQNIHYRIANPKILQACRLMREVLIERIEQAGRLIGGESK